MSEQKPCFMCDPSILEQGQRCATGAPICDRHRDQLTGNMRPPTAAELALTARAEAAEQQAARLRAAGERLYFELQDAAFGYDLVPPRVQEDAKPALEAWRTTVAASQPAPAAETNDGLCPRCGCCSGFGQPDGSVVCIGRCDVPERHAELARGGQAEGEG